MRKFTGFILCVATTCLLMIRGAAVPIPTLNLRSLVDVADTIVAGEVAAVTDGGTTMMKIRGRDVSVHIVQAQMHVDRIIKGKSDRDIEFRVLLPEPGMGYHGVSANSYRVVLLKHGSDDLELTSPYYPSFPAVSDHASQGDNPFDSVVGEIEAVLRSATASDDDKTAAIWYLRTIRSNTVTQTLQFAASHGTNIVVRMSAVGTLLARNDLSVLPVAEQVLTNPQVAVPDYIRQNLASAISEGVKGDPAVPVLTNLLRNPDVRVRRAAAMALRNTKTEAAIDGLALALDDADVKVRYYAVIGLAEVTRQNEWRPLEAVFNRNQSRYVAYWKSWSSSRR